MLDILYNKFLELKNALDNKNRFIFAEAPQDKKIKIEKEKKSALDKIKIYDDLLKAYKTKNKSIVENYTYLRGIEVSKSHFNKYDFLALSPYTQSFIIENEQVIKLTSENWEKRLFSNNGTFDDVSIFKK